MEKNNPFKVPDNYFQEFKLEIMDKLPKKDGRQKNKKISLRNSIMKWSAVAAIIIVFIFVGFGYIDNHNKYLVSDTNHNKEDMPVLTTDQQYASLQNDYYLFLEDQTTTSMYRDALNSDDL